MKEPVVIVGLGEMGGVFARGLLRLGHPVYPVLRGDSLEAAARERPDPRLVLVAVAEADLDATLDAIPAPWRGRIGLLQNELLPRDWAARPLRDPTVISVWFEKKRGQDVRVLIASPAYGPQAPLLVAALGRIDIPAREVTSPAELEFELVRKNAYILATNLCGLALPAGTTVQTLWQGHRALALEVLDEVLAIQDHLTGHLCDRQRVIAGVAEGIAGDPEHRCMGRTAPARLGRALHLADAALLAVPVLRGIAARMSAGRP